MFMLAVSGPTGAGKSTIAKMIGQHDGVELARERIPRQLFLEFSVNPRKYCYELQKQIVLSRAKEIGVLKSRIQVIDRTICEDIEVFFRLHRELGYLTERQLIDLLKIAKRYEVKIGSPDAIVFVTAKPFRLKERMIIQENPVFLIESINIQLRLYERWRNGIDNPVLDIENTNLTMDQLQSITEWIYYTLPKLEAGEAPKFNFLDFNWKR